MKNRFKNKRGFTLVELIIVIAVIGVLAAILIPVFSNVIKKANAKSALADARNAVSMYVTESLDRRVHGDTSSPENITIIVEKGGRYYAFGYNTAASNSILVSNANEDGMSASDLDALIHDYSFNVRNGGTYDPNTTYTLSDGVFYLVPYTGTTSDNPAVRGFVTSTSASGNFFRLDEEAADYGFDLNVGNTTAVFHGCLVNGTYETTTVSSAPASTPTATPTPSSLPDPVTHTVTFAISGVDDEDRANVVIKQNGTAVTGSSVTVTGNDTPVSYFTAEYPHNESSDEKWYNFVSKTPASGFITADTEITFNFSKVEKRTLTFSLPSGVSFVPGESGVDPSQLSMRLDKGTIVTDYIRKSSADNGNPAETFLRWEDQNGTHYEATGGSVSLTENLTLTPVFGARNVTVTYKAGTNGTGSDVQETVTYGSHTLKTFESTHFTANSGYSFYRWLINGTEYAEGASYTFTGNTTITAKYSELQFSVEYIQVTGVISVPAKQYYPVGTASVPIDRDGVVIDDMYVRDGWQVGNYHQTGLAEYTESLNTSAITAGTNITLTVGLAKKRLQVTFASSPAGAAGLPGTTYYNYADGLTYTISATPTLSGYDFTGYTLTSSTGVTVALSGDMGRTLTIAKSGSIWAAGTATVTANFTATATPTPVATPTPTPVAANSFTLNLKYLGRNGTGTPQYQPWVINLAVGETINFNVTQLKQAGVYRTYNSSTQMNHISVTLGSSINASTGVYTSGGPRYEFSYTRAAGDGDSFDFEIYTSGCRYPDVTDAIGYQNSAPDLPTVNTYVSTSVISTDFASNTRSIPGVTNPEEIWFTEQLEEIGQSSTNMTKNYILCDDIVLSGNWTPLGHGMDNGADLPFTGTLDGDGYSISGLSANWPASGNTEYPYIGLFSIIGQNATIADLTITNATVNGAYYVGILAGANRGNIDNVTVSGTVSAYSLTNVSNAVGGLVGINTGHIEDSEVTAVTVTGYYGVGGFVGENADDATIQNSSVTVTNINSAMTLSTLRNPTNEALVEDMAPTQGIGGFCGYNAGTINTTCSATVAANGIIKGYEYVGGFCGYNDVTGQIASCTSNGVNIEAYYCAGGFVGFNAAETGTEPDIGTITNCTANVLGINSSMTMDYMYNPTEEAEEDDKYSVRIIGGFAGQNEGAITGCAMALDATDGVINAYSDVGGFVGVNTTVNGIISNSHATNVNLYGALNAGGFAGKNEFVITATTGGVQSLTYATVKQINGELTDEDIETYVVTCVGGFVGLNNGLDTTNRATIENAYVTILALSENQMGIVGGYQAVGGFAGGNAALGDIENCFADDVNLYGISNVGGFVGENASSGSGNDLVSGSIINCHLSLYGINNILGDTELTANPVLSIGGFAGLNDAEIMISYVSFNTDAMVTGRQYVGGFVGYNDGNGSISGIGSNANNEVTITNPCDASDVILYGYWYVGGFAGQNDGTIEYSTAEVIDIDGYMDSTVMSSKVVNYVGGFCGYNENTINYCDVTFNGDSSGIYGINNVGGFVGYNTYNGAINLCTATNPFIFAYNYVGGFAGQNEGSALTAQGTITNSTVYLNGINSTMTDSMVANTSFVGGFVGLNDAVLTNDAVKLVPNTSSYIIMGYAKVGGFFGRNTERGVITTSDCTGAYIYGIQLVGGFGGENYGNVSQSYANIYAINYNLSASDLSSTAVSFVGGLIGANRGTVQNCYVLCAGQVRGAYYVGGLMGANYQGGAAINCFSDATPYGTNSSAYSISYRDNTQTMTGIFFVATSGSSAGATRVSRNTIKSTSFQSLATSAGWSTSVWSFPGSSYPVLINNPM